MRKSLFLPLFAITICTMQGALHPFGLTKRVTIDGQEIEFALEPKLNADGAWFALDLRVKNHSKTTFKLPLYVGSRHSLWITLNDDSTGATILHTLPEVTSAPKFMPRTRIIEIPAGGEFSETYLLSDMLIKAELLQLSPTVRYRFFCALRGPGLSNIHFAAQGFHIDVKSLLEKARETLEELQNERKALKH